ncbi:CRISPR-associated endonuclease Cas1 [Candidatus Woesearchaeota archaeon]|nr:CRISPR-associated endonuclease Cas1 [Candidatus Woesearchaeota archaeon]
MQIVIDKFGTFIGKIENRFQIKTKDKKEEYSADNVSQILIASPCSVSAGAVKLAMEKEIDIVYTNYFGTPYARIYPCKLGGTTLTRRRQLEAYYSDKGQILVKNFIRAKTRNQLYLLKSLSKERNNLFSAEIKELELNKNNIDNLSGKIDDLRQELLGIEGYFASKYFECLTKIIPFEIRDRKSEDEFNIMLNYGYGILYNEIERACIISGLDPYLGFLHTDRYGKPCMTLDLIEEFRQPIVDRAIITLVSQKQLDDKHFENVEDRYMLSKSGRKKVLEAVLGRLTKKIKFNNKKLTFKQVILEQARNIVRFLLDQTKSYEPFIYRW